MQIKLIHNKGIWDIDYTFFDFKLKRLNIKYVIVYETVELEKIKCLLAIQDLH